MTAAPQDPAAPASGAERTAVSTLMMIAAAARALSGTRVPLDTAWVLAMAEAGIDRAQRFAAAASADKAEA